MSAELCSPGRWAQLQASRAKRSTVRARWWWGQRSWSASPLQGGVVGCIGEDAWCPEVTGGAQELLLLLSVAELLDKQDNERSREHKAGCCQSTGAGVNQNLFQKGRILFTDWGMSGPVPRGCTPEHLRSHPDKSFLAGKGASGVEREVPVQIRAAQVAVAGDIQHWTADGLALRGVPSPGSSGCALTALWPDQLKPWLAGKVTDGAKGEVLIEVEAAQLSMLWSTEQ